MKETKATIVKSYEKGAVVRLAFNNQAGLERNPRNIQTKLTELLRCPSKLIVKLIVKWQKAMPNMALSAISHHDTYVYRKIVEISLTPNSKLEIYRLRLICGCGQQRQQSD